MAVPDQSPPLLDPYHHVHRGVAEISWSRLGELLAGLAGLINRDFRPELVVGVAKGGVIPGVFLSSAYLVDFFPIKLSSRHNEQVVSETPSWYIYPTEHVRDRAVLLVDDICVAGRTLRLAAAELLRQGAREVRSATIAVHEGSVRPDYFALQTNDLIVWPWDRDVLAPDGRWSLSPEYRAEWDEINAPNASSIETD